MKYILSTILLLSLQWSSVQAEGIEFFHGTFAEAKAKAMAEDKIIFMDAYTTWCGPCKRMAKNVFKREDVGTFFNENFINLKVDMEKGEGPTIAREFRVRAYPTLLFINGKGDLVHKDVGGKRPEQFIELGKTVISKLDNTEDLKKLYEEGDRSPKLMFKYLKALQRKGESSTKVANEYIASQKDLSTEFNLKFLFQATTRADSKVFEKLVENKAALSSFYKQEEIDKKIKAACFQTVKKAAEFGSTDLLKEAKAKMKHHSDKFAKKKFKYGADVEYASMREDAALFKTAAQTYHKKIAKKNPDYAVALIERGLKFKDKDLNTLMLDYAKKAYKKEEKYITAAAYAKALFQNENKDEATTIAKKAIGLAKKEAINPKDMAKLLQMLRTRG